MNCTNFNEKILEIVLDGSSLDAQTKAHCDSCHSCNQEFKELKNALSVSKQMSVLEPPAWLKTRIMARLDDIRAEKKSFFARLASWFEIGLAPAPLSVMALVIVASLVVFKAPKDTQTLSELNGASQVVSVLPPNAEQPGFLDTMDAAASLTAAPQSLPLIDNHIPEGQLTFAELKSRFELRKKALLEADADMLMMRGRRFKAMGRVDLALNDFETIYQFYPDYSYLGDVLMYRAQCFAFQGKIDKAIESLKIYEEKFPSKLELIQPMIKQLEDQQK